ncbi:MAG: type II toxin-antitoxin system VapC family toxin [Rhizobiales bacterium]|nr:type II toxin-antitoxin system VapC family toxin [Hyphomicrobiales bacterium]
MIGLDTSVLIRHLTQDEPDQAARASALIEKSCSTEEPGYVNRVVMCEIVWVLERAYRYQRTIIADCIETILRTADLRVENEKAVWTALARYQEGFDFADALIAETNAMAGVAATATFDRKACALKGLVGVD